MRDCRLVAAVECISDSCDSESSERVRNSARLRTLSLSGREDLEEVTPQMNTLPK